jgi:hypothetical protein
MSLSSEEAAKSLSEAVQAQRRSSELYFYRRSSPHLIMWGIIWIIGYGGTALFPDRNGILWDVLVVLGMIGGVAISHRHRRDPSIGGFRAWRLAALWAIIIFFVGATYAIMHPQFSKQYCAFPALITGCAYMAVGLWSGIRYVISGMVVVALTLFGFFSLDPHIYFYWMAVVGGGAMILTGIWFRTV